MSEPEYLLSVMARHQGWCAVICLIGGGQEINKGEAELMNGSKQPTPARQIGSYMSQIGCLKMIISAELPELSSDVQRDNRLSSCYLRAVF